VITRWNTIPTKLQKGTLRQREFHGAAVANRRGERADRPLPA
jgi:hypothetical protein